MKKINLKLDGIKAMLTKEQMKGITGGYSGECGCNTNFYPGFPNYNCQSIYSCDNGASLYCTTTYGSSIGVCTNGEGY